MATVYYQAPAGLTLSLALTSAPGIEPVVTAFAEDSEVAGLYATAAGDGAAGQIATVLLGSAPFDGGVTSMADDGRLWVMPRTSSPATGTGVGARTVAITVDDGANPLEAAKVRITNGALSFTQATNGAGLATFNVDDATWQVAVTKPGYSFAGASLVVDGDEAATFSMALAAIAPPAEPGLSAIEILCVSPAGQPKAGVEVAIRIIAVPGGSQNIAFEAASQRATSGDDGRVRFEVPQGSTCEWKRGIADSWQKVAIDSDDVTSVTSVIGAP